MSEYRSESVALSIERSEQEQCEAEQQALAKARELSSEFSTLLEENRDMRAELPWPQLERLKASGLTNAVIPPSRGGLGLRWPVIGRIVREIAAGDGSVGALLGYHTMQLFHLRREPTERWHGLERRIAGERLWLAGVVNPRDDNVQATPVQDGFVLNGRKNFCTGNGVADLLTLSITLPDGQAGFVLVPATTAGVKRQHNWDAIGLERSESGSVVLEDVRVARDQITLDDDDAAGRFLSTIRGPVNQSIFVNFYTGYTEGAVRATRHFVHDYARPWLRSDAETAADDTLIRSRFGELWVEHQASLALADRALENMQVLLAAAEGFSDEQRGEAAAAVATAKAHAARKGLAVCSDCFELMGARATSNRYALDRFWRDLRTHSLHDPIMYKLLEVGDYALNGRYAEPGAYQ